MTEAFSFLLWAVTYVRYVYSQLDFFFCGGGEGTLLLSCWTCPP